MPSIAIKPSQIKTRVALAMVRDLAVDQPELRSVVERAAIQLDAADMLVDAWAAPRTAPATERESDALTLLDESPAALEAPGRHYDYDLAVKVLDRHLECGYQEAYDRLERATKTARESMTSEPNTMGALLKRAGLKSLPDAEADLRLLETADTVRTQESQAAKAQLDGDRIDPLGRVLLDDGFDIPGLLHSDEQLERRYRRVCELDASYAGSRERFENDDRLHLDANIDLLRTIERPIRIAEAREHVRRVNETLDAAIDTSHEPAERVKRLDAAVTSIAASRASGGDVDVPARSAGVVRTLDRPTSFADLPADLLQPAIDLWDQNEHRISLDAAAAVVTGHAPRGDGIPNAIDQSAQLSGTQLGPRGEVADQIAKHVAEHKCTWLCGLEHVAGPGLRLGS